MKFDKVQRQKMQSFVIETCFCPGPSDTFVLLGEMATELSKRCVTYITHIKIMPHRELSIVCILKASTDVRSWQREPPRF